MRARFAAVLGAVLLAAGCAQPGPRTPQPRDGRAGLYLAGTIGGRQVAVSDGQPELVTGERHPCFAADEKVCFVGRDIDGARVVIAVENPAVLESGVTLPVAAVACGNPAACDRVRGGALVRLLLGTGRWREPTGGRLELDLVEPGRRYRGALRLRFRDGSLSGQFDVVPRPVTRR